MVAPSWNDFSGPEDIKEPIKEFKQEISGEMVDNKTPEPKKPEWGNFDSPETYQGEIDPTADEGTIDYIVRNALTGASRVAEQVAGRYGNIEKFAKDTLVNLPMTGGVIGWAISELIGPERWENIVRGPEANAKNKQGLESTTFPTSQSLRKASEKITGGYTKPKTKGEEAFSELVEDIGSTVSPTRGLTAFNNLLVPSATNVTKQIVKETGFGEDKANMAKMAVWLPLSLAGNVNGSRYASNLMNQGRNGLPNNLQVNVPRFTNALDAIERSPLMLSSDPRTAPARQLINGIRQDLANGQTNIQSLLTMYDGVNAAKRNRGMFDIGRQDQNFARRAVDEVRDAVRDQIMDVGVNHPQALQNWENGVKAWAVIHQSNAITNRIEQIAKGPYAKMLTGPAAGLFGLGTIGAAKSPIVAGTLGLGVPAAHKTGQVLYRMWNDPNLANYYWNAISAVQTENIPAFINNYTKLNTGLEKSVTPTEKKAQSKKH